jgi:hypothetical protein
MQKLDKQQHVCHNYKWSGGTGSGSDGDRAIIWACSSLFIYHY